MDHNRRVSSSLEARVAEHCRRHGLLPAGAPVLAMVSGGADSTCLMHVLAAVHDGPVGVLTVDHGLRPEAEVECAAVVEAARGLGLDAHVARLRMTAGSGAQARARDLRLDRARRLAAERGYAAIATGHTASDQAETVLFRLARGTGRAGALGMAPRRDDLVRPLLCVDGAETRAWCAARRFAVAGDPSNADPRYARTRVREGLLGALAAVHPGAEAHVAAFADALRDEAELLRPLEDAAWARARDGGGLRIDRLREEPDAMRRILARRLIASAGTPMGAVGAATVARVLALLDGGVRTGLPGGGSVGVERGVLVALGPPAAAPGEAALGVPGRVRFGAVELRAGAGDGGPPTPGRVAVRDLGPLTVRPPRPGDRLPLPGGGHVAVGRLLASRGVPARARAGVPVVATPERVVWVAGHRAADDLLVTDRVPALILEMEAA